jgi:hypothetical protein
MGKFSNFVLGAAAGAAVAAVITYVLGPAHDTAYDATYQSRLDKALEEGERAAEEHEADLRRQFERAKRGENPQLPSGGSSAALGPQA